MSTSSVRTVIALILVLPLLSCGGRTAPGPAGSAPDDPSPPAPVDPYSELVALGSEPRGGDGYRAWGLTGRNKQNGPVQRYRRWVAPETPAGVPRTLDDHELWLAEPAAGGWLTLYGREGIDYREVASYRARFYQESPDADAADGDMEVRWELDLNRYLRRGTLVEIQDLRYDGDDLYFNEACLTYAREADGQCSSLVRVDPATGTVVWRARDLVSNDIFLLLGRGLVTGYGFTEEPDSVFLLDPASGAVLDAHPLDTAHSYLELRGDTLHVVTRQRIHRFLLR